MIGKALSPSQCVVGVLKAVSQSYDGGVKVDAYFLVPGLKADMLHCSLTLTVSQILMLPTY